MAKGETKNNKNKNKSSDKGNAKKKLLNDVEKEFNQIEKRREELEQRMNKKEQQVSETKERLIKNLFALMKDVGVDPSNREDINGFLQTLNAKNPDLLELFETAFNDLLGSEVNPEEEQSREGEEDITRSVGLERQSVPEFSGLRGLSNKVKGSGAPPQVDENPASRAARSQNDGNDGESAIQNFQNLEKSALK